MATVAPPAATPYAGVGWVSAVLDWATTTDHKKIGILYIVSAFAFAMVGGAFSLVMRTELAETGAILDAHLYNQFFTMHGTIMLFLFILPVSAGFMNYIVPLQLGAADMAFPRINALSYWMFAFGGVLLISSFAFDGGSASAGWTSYAPVSSNTGNNAQPLGIGVDLWLVGVVILGAASTAGAINFLTTIFKMRAPGLTMFRLSLFTWTTLVTSFLVLLATPVLAATLILLFADRNGAGGAFFDPTGRGGQVLLWQNLFWFYSHPAVYIMVLPAMGAVSEIIPVFSRKPLFGYTSMVLALVAIGLLGFIVWAHHMFTTGGVFLPFFMASTFLIAIPTGVKFFNWMATMFRGAVQLTSAMLFAVGFLMLFLIGGITGVFFAAVPVDFALHDTYFVVSHLHYVLATGSAFGVFAAVYYWYPKMFGRMMNEGLGKVHFALTFLGANMLFWPQLMLGLDGMPRRINDYAANGGWELMNMISSIGAFVVAVAVLPFLFNLIYSAIYGPRAPDDPWEANTLEWATTSPPPPHNFDSLPEIRSERPLFDQRWGVHEAEAHSDGSEPPPATPKDG